MYKSPGAQVCAQTWAAKWTLRRAMGREALHARAARSLFGIWLLLRLRWLLFCVFVLTRPRGLLRGRQVFLSFSHQEHFQEVMVRELARFLLETPLPTLRILQFLLDALPVIAHLELFST